MKCANCDSDALYIYDPPSLVATPYCDSHLPNFLRGSAKSGVLTRTDSFAETRQSALEALATPQPEQETPVAEEAPAAEQPRAPKRRRTKKTTEAAVES